MMSASKYNEVLANRRYFGLSREFKNRAHYPRTNVKLYNTLIPPVLLYGAETCLRAKAGEAILDVFEREEVRSVLMRSMEVERTVNYLSYILT